MFHQLGHLTVIQATSAIVRLKALADLPGYITDEPQDGRISGDLYGIAGDCRLAVLPTVNGERANVRLPALGALPDPDGLGLPQVLVSDLRAAVRRSAGLVLVCGPTGAGKTTTIHSLLRELAAQRPDRHVLSIEDPVERRLPDVTQVEVTTRCPALACLRVALRHDPDVLVVGEIRDGETAATAVRSALTGHLVVATLHIGRAVEAVPRLIDLGVAVDLLLPSLVAVSAQRLIRLIHPACAGAGCGGCAGGFLGRRAVADFIAVDGEARSAWRSGRSPALTHGRNHRRCTRLWIGRGMASGATPSGAGTGQGVAGDVPRRVMVPWMIVPPCSPPCGR
ncbi:hypothetical protein LBMAG53_17420 [Planctomycetota bacterium]|nr:hypothetical protein LBMAG53_17420 [Planctomycetota bacterium]